MKVKAICNLTNQEKFLDLPMENSQLLNLQGDLMNRDSNGYLLGADVNYFDMDGNEIEEIFSKNKELLNFY